MDPFLECPFLEVFTHKKTQQNLKPCDYRAFLFSHISIGALGFLVFDVFLIGFSIFVSKDFSFFGLVFIAVCGIVVF